MDIAALGIAMDTSGLKKGEDALNRTAQSANRAADAMDKAGTRGSQGLGKVGQGAAAAESQLERLRRVSASVASQMGSIGGSVGGLPARFSALASSGAILGGVLTALGTGSLLAARSMIRASDELAPMASRILLVSDSAKEAASTQERLFQIAQQGRVSFVELGNTYAQLARAGREMGVSTERLLNVTKTISQSLTISGGSAQSMQAALVQLSQGMAAGTLRGEELNSVMEQTPRLAQAIAQGLGVPIGKLREMGKEGELTAERVIEALESAARQVEADFTRITPTVSQAFQTMENSTQRFWGELDKALGVSRNLAAAIVSVGTALDQVTPAAASFASTMAGAIAAYNRYGMLNIGQTALGMAFGSSPKPKADTSVMDAEDARLARQGATARQSVREFGEANAAITKLRENFSGVSKHYKQALADIDKAVKVGALTEAQAAQMRVQAQQKWATGPKGGKRGGGGGAAAAQYQNAMGGELAELEAYARERKSIERGILIDLDTERAQRLMTEREYIQRVYQEKENALIDEQTIAQQQADIAGGRKQLAERERYLGKVVDLEQQIVNNKKEMTNALVKEDMRATDSLNAYVAALENSLKVRRSEVDSEIAVMGRGDRAREELGRIIAANREADQKFYDLSRSLSEGRVSKSEYDAQLAELRKYQAARIKLEYETTAKLKEAQGDWSLGARRALENFHDSAENIFGATDEFVGRSLQSMEDRLINFARTGKFSIRDMANSIADDLLRIQIRSMMSGLMGGQGTGGGNMLMGLIGAGASLLGGGGFGFGAAASVAGGSLGTIAGSQQSMMLAAQVFHEGGIVGSPARGRSVPMSTFSGAPRYHSGGMAGDEVPAILQRGEEVLTRKDPRHALNGGGGRTTVMNNTFVLPPEGATKATQNQMARRAYRAALLANRRNG